MRLLLQSGELKNSRSSPLSSTQGIIEQLEAARQEQMMARGTVLYTLNKSELQSTFDGVCTWKRGVMTSLKCSPQDSGDL